MKKSRWGGSLGEAVPAVALLFAMTMPWFVYALLAMPPVAVEVDAADPNGVVIESTPTPTPQVEEGGLIAITFDDGPRRTTTTALLDGLSQRGCPATFFLIGAQIAGNEDIILRMEGEGHQIGIHSYDHEKLEGLNQVDFDAQVERERGVLTALLGYDDFMLRPPYGMHDQQVQTMAESPIILWSIDPEDWQNHDVDALVAEVVAEAQDGSIILMHDIFEESVEAALAIVDALHEKGYLFCTIEELFEAKNIALEDGGVYWNGYG